MSDPINNVFYTATGEKFSIQNCDEEPIHLCETVQHKGFLVAFCKQGMELQVFSENFEELFSVSPNVGSTAAEELFTSSGSFGQTILQKLSENGTREAIQVKLKTNAFRSDRWEQLCPGVAYCSGHFLVIELEPIPKGNLEELNITTLDADGLLPSNTSLLNLEALASAIAERVQTYSGFDRVMVYRLDQEFNGTVIAEARSATVDSSYFGMQFPAADIPPQARRLYELNWIRSVFDVNEEPVILSPRVYKAGRTPLDLTYSVIRAVSPFHIQYLKNMGVQATLSISIMKNGRLWGLVACHHYSAHYLSQGKRLTLELAGQVYSSLLASCEQNLTTHEIHQANQAFSDIFKSFSTATDLEDNLSQNMGQFLNIMRSCGVAIFTDEGLKTFGTVPGLACVSTIAEKLKSSAEPRTTYTHQLHTLFPEDDINHNLLNGCCGALFAPLAFHHPAHVIWFRSAREKTVKWAGKGASESKSEQSNRLSPRGSFELWQEVVRNESERWQESDAAIADNFNKVILNTLLERKSNFEKQLKHYEELNQAKDQFLASISHELRSPLNAITGWTDIALYDKNDTEKMVKALEVIKRSAATQAELINDLLDLSRIISGTLRLSLHSISVMELFHDAAQSFEAAVATKDIKFKIDISEQHRILGDKIRLKQIVTNLLSNAIKFTPKGGSVTLRGYRKYSNFVVEVEDTGKGISEADLKRVFDRFFQCARTHGQQGLGLGLSIVKQLVELHGGEISVSSAGEGLGTSFIASFPLAPVVNQQQPETVSAPAPDNPRSKRLAGLSIVVAEDENDSLQFVTTFLEDHGAKVFATADGSDAWTVIQSRAATCDLLLSDIGMPVMDGLALVEKIRKSEDAEISSIRAIAFTAYAYASDRVKALKAGFNSYVSKPVDAEELLTIIEMEASNIKPQK